MHVRRPNDVRLTRQRLVHSLIPGHHLFLESLFALLHPQVLAQTFVLSHRSQARLQSPVALVHVGVAELELVHDVAHVRLQADVPIHRLLDLSVVLFPPAPRDEPAGTAKDLKHA